MSTLKVTAFEAEALVLSNELPIPIEIPESGGTPINPLSFPADWGTEITISTRWQTDITKAQKKDNQERWGLVSRPSRKVTFQVTAMDKQEVSSILQSAIGHALVFGSPVPLYPDAVDVSGSDGTTIFGDFRYRRFFAEARVAVMPITAPLTRASNSVFYAIIKSVQNDRIELYSVERTVTVADMVIPCIDCELSSTIDGVALTDSVWTSSMTFSEVEGANLLPGLWPPTSPQSAEVLRPICTIADDLPVFPFDPNWADGITVAVSREMSTEPSSRSLIQTPSGSPKHSFELDLMGYNRPRSWSILRFFDSMRGRQGSFYFHHPTQPWKAHSTLVPLGAENRCYIQPTGDPIGILSSFRRVAVFRADGTFEVREVVDCVDLSDKFSVVLDSNLPDTNFVSVQPIFVCSFDSDEIQEQWATTEVAVSLTVRFSETPAPGPVSASGQNGLLFQIPNPAFQSIEGMNLLLRAGAGCLDANGNVCSTWPGNSRVARWRDISYGPERQFRQTAVVQEMVDVALSPPNSNYLVRFPGPFENNKQQCIIDPQFSLDYQLSADTPPGQRSLWSEDGWTLCICFTPTSYQWVSHADRDVVAIGDVVGYHIRILVDRVSGGSALQIANAAGTLITTALTVDFRAITSAVYMTVHVDNATQKARMWINGQQATASSVSLVGGIYRATNDYTLSRWFFGLPQTRIVPNSTALSTAFGKDPCANLVVSYDRPLSIDDVNILHTIVSDMFRSSRDISALYA